MRGLVILCLFAISALGQEYNPVARERGPESISRLPLDVRLDLVKRKCLIPEYKGTTGREDGAYTMGHFRSRASVDYAVVCHIPARKVQDVLVYSNPDGVWKGEAIQRGTFDPAPHVDKCEAEVGIAPPKYILDHARAYAPEELEHLPKLDHDGVDVWICEKASVVYYLHQGTWLVLQGAD
jgi:hypothetical protein